MSKYGEYSHNHWEALGNMLGGKEVIDALLAGKKRVIIEDVIQNIFDRHGRCIPRDQMSSVCDPDKTFCLKQPKINFADRLDRLVKGFSPKTAFCSATEFEREIMELQTLINANPKFKNWNKGVWLPVVLPQTKAGDYGTIFEKRFLAAAMKAFVVEFPEQGLINYLAGDLSEQVEIVHPSHRRLVEKMIQGPVVGIFLANPLQGFPIHACREFANSLPEVHLAGGFDWATTFVAYPDVLAENTFTPCHACSALQWSSTNYSFLFGVNGNGFFFDKSDSVGCKIISGGLFITR